MEEGMKEENLTSAIEECFGAGTHKTISQSALTLAFVGDCVFDLVIRTVLATHEGGSNKMLHRKATSIVNAASQARMIEIIEESLTQEELAAFHHGRNAKSSSSAKNASIADYRKATGFESLIGYLYLEGKYERLVELIKQGMDGVWKQEN